MEYFRELMRPLFSQPLTEEQRRTILQQVDKWIEEEESYGHLMSSLSQPITGEQRRAVLQKMHKMADTASKKDLENMIEARVSQRINDMAKAAAKDLEDTIEARVLQRINDMAKEVAPTNEA